MARRHSHKSALPFLAFTLSAIYRYFVKSVLSPVEAYLTFLSAQNLNPLMNRLLARWAKKRDNKAKIVSLKAQLDNDADNVELYKALARCYVIAGNKQAKAWAFVFNNQPDARDAFDYLLNTAICSKDFTVAQVLINKAVNCVDIEIIQMTLDDLQQYQQQIDVQVKASGFLEHWGLRKAQNAYIEIGRYSLGLSNEFSPELVKTITGDAKQFSETFEHIANLYAEHELYRQAANNYRIAIAFYGGTECYLKLGKIAASYLGDYQEALDCFERVIEVDPGNVEGYDCLGNLLEYHLHQYEDAKRA